MRTIIGNTQMNTCQGKINTLINLLRFAPITQKYKTRIRKSNSLIGRNSNKIVYRTQKIIAIKQKIANLQLRKLTEIDITRLDSVNLKKFKEKILNTKVSLSVGKSKFKYPETAISNIARIDLLPQKPEQIRKDFRKKSKAIYNL